MNKVLLTMIVVGCLLSITIGAASAFPHDFDRFFRLDYNLSPNPVINGDFLNPVYFKKWQSDEFDYTWGYKSTILNSKAYVLVDLFDVVNEKVTNQRVGVIKLNLDNGYVEKNIVFEFQRSSSDIIAFENHIYVIIYGESGYPKMIKLDEDLTILDSKYMTLEGNLIEPRCVKVDNNYIYVTGITHISGGPQENIFIGKFDGDINLVWDDYVYIDKGDDSIGYNSLAIDFNGDIYLTGSAIIDDETDVIYILKFDSNGNLLLEKVTSDEDELNYGSISIHDNKLFVSKIVYSGIGLNFDMLISTYDKNLNLLWESEQFDESIFIEFIEDMVFIDEFVYCCGYICDIDFDQGTFISENGFILKYNLETQEKEWCRKVPSYSDSWSIHKDEDKNLYLSGLIYDENDDYAYFLKVDTKNDPPATPEIKGVPNGSPGKENTYTISTTDPEGNHVYYFVDWGDNTFEHWIGPFESGEEVVVRHTYENKGRYTIKVIAKDIHDAKSGEGELTVSMPRSRAKSTPLLDFLQENSILLKLLQRIFFR